MVITFIATLIAGSLLGGMFGIIVYLYIYNTRPKKVSVKIVNKSVNLEPFYETEGASGMDLRANENVFVRARGKALVKTGLFVSIPKGYELQVRPRSGLALKNGISVLNTPGTIDADYRGEIGVILINNSDESFMVKTTERIAQMVLVPIAHASWNKLEQLDKTLRGTGGFGHTGVK